MIKPYVIGMTGASGMVYAFRLLRFLLNAGYGAEIVISDAAKAVIRQEMSADFEREGLAGILGEQGCAVSPGLWRLHDVHDLLSPLASGSYPVEAMVIIPCSMGTLGSISSGISQNLIHRAADCAIKEGRKLVLVPRETPFSAIHLENMLKLARLGVSIVPPVPAFYTAPKSLEDLVDFVVGKVLDQLGIVHALYSRWPVDDRRVRPDADQNQNQDPCRTDFLY